MPLSKNCLYTHEIAALVLNVEHLPTRMGYVVRCSAQEAIWKDRQTWLVQRRELLGAPKSEASFARGSCPNVRKLEPATTEGMAAVRSQYAEENFSDARVDYGEVDFSMNKGDYIRPLLCAEKEFRCMGRPSEFSCVHTCATPVGQEVAARR